MLNNAIVLMTALIPTRGHEELIKFASHATSGEVIVMVNSRDIDPVPGYIRHNALEVFVDQNSLYNVKVVLDHDKNPPQNPKTKKQWAYWTDRIRSYCNFVIGNNTAVIGSEPYCEELAKRLSCKFLPYDIQRLEFDVKGSDVRSDIRANWAEISESAKSMFKKDFVIFGAESCGKTTMTKALSEAVSGSHFVPEYARGYLEFKGSKLSKEKMMDISVGQFALQQKLYANTNFHTTFFDTDLLSTIGYYKILGWSPEVHNPNLINNYYMFSDDYVYFIMPDDIPFEPDELRYGGDVRESDRKFWKDVCEDYGATYYYVPSGTFEEKKAWILAKIDELFEKEFGKIQNFERD